MYYILSHAYIFLGEKYKAYITTTPWNNIEPPYSIFMKPQTADCGVIANAIHNA